MLTANATLLTLMVDKGCDQGACVLSANATLLTLMVDKGRGQGAC